MRHRKNIRLRHYDYSSNAYYFVTICCAGRLPHLEQYKKQIEETLNSLPLRFKGLSIDSFVLMPDHLHMIFVFDDTGISLGAVVRSFKALITKSIGRSGLWQRNYYEHVIRDEQALSRVREYIHNNPGEEKIDFKKFYYEPLP